MGQRHCAGCEMLSDDAVSMACMYACMHEIMGDGMLNRVAKVTTVQQPSPPVVIGRGVAQCSVERQVIATHTAGICHRHPPSGEEQVRSFGVFFSLSLTLIIISSPSSPPSASIPPLSHPQRSPHLLMSAHPAVPDTQPATHPAAAAGLAATSQPQSSSASSARSSMTRTRAQFDADTGVDPSISPRVKAARTELTTDAPTAADTMPNPTGETGVAAPTRACLAHPNWPLTHSSQRPRPRRDGYRQCYHARSPRGARMRHVRWRLHRGKSHSLYTLLPPPCPTMLTFPPAHGA